MVYELRCYTLLPGKMPEYLKAAETIGRPARGQNFGVNTATGRPSSAR